MITTLTDKIKENYIINKEEALSLVAQDLEELCSAANEIREHFCKNHFDICSIVNGKSGKCSENCKFCAQSAYYKVEIESYQLLTSAELLKEGMENERAGILRYSIVTSGKSLTDTEIEEICKSYRYIKQNSEISLCASHGLLNFEQFEKLKASGVKRYHNNLETSQKNFSSICTTHKYEDKIEAIMAAQKAGLEVCSGGIMGLGETMEDRIDMAIDIRRLGIKSVPINILSPIKGTPFEDIEPLSIEEIRRIVAIYRFILPKSALRLAGGRGLLADKGRSVFLSGANAAISGDMLTTSGISTASDMAMIKELGFKISKI